MESTRKKTRIRLWQKIGPIESTYWCNGALKYHNGGCLSVFVTWLRKKYEIWRLRNGSPGYKFLPTQCTNRYNILPVSADELGKTSATRSLRLMEYKYLPARWVFCQIVFYQSSDGEQRFLLVSSSVPPWWRRRAWCSPIENGSQRIFSESTLRAQ